MNLINRLLRIAIQMDNLADLKIKDSKTKSEISMEQINNMDVCEHCGQELKKASAERKEIKEIQESNILKVGDALTERQNKLDIASAEMLDIIQRIEKKVGADTETLDDVRRLEAKIREKIESKYAQEFEENK